VEVQPIQQCNQVGYLFFLLLLNAFYRGMKVQKILVDGCQGLMSNCQKFTVLIVKRFRKFLLMAARV
jgi:hypothetical protein